MIEEEEKEGEEDKKSKREENWSWREKNFMSLLLVLSMYTLDCTELCTVNTKGAQTFSKAGHNLDLTSALKNMAIIM